MSKIGFLFPGQGSQYLGMGREFYEAYPFLREIFEQASSTLGTEASRLCFEGPEEVLKETQNTQPLVLTTSFASLEVLKRRGINPHLVAGHSLGEYTALVAAGALDFLAALKLVRKRGRFMQEASREHPGTMAAIIGLEEKRVNAVLEEAGSFGQVVAANFNGPAQVVISGEILAVEKAKEIAERAGARKVVILKVAGAFHSPLMEPARKKLQEEIEKSNIRSPLIPLVANVTADYLREPQAIKEALINQVTSPVLWEASVRKMLEAGVTTFIEVGPGKVLSGLLRRISPKSLSLNVEDEESLKKTWQKLEKCNYSGIATKTPRH